MDLIKSALRDEFFPALFGGEEVSIDLQALSVHGVKCRGIRIPDPQKEEVQGHETLEASCEALVESFLGSTDLIYVGNWYFIRKFRAWLRKYGRREKTAALG